MKRVDLEEKNWIGGLSGDLYGKGKGKEMLRVEKKETFRFFLRERKLYLVKLYLVDFLERIYIYIY